MNKKEAYEEKMDAKMKELAAEIDVLKAKAKEKSASIKLDMLQEIEALEVKKEVSKAKLKHLRASDQNAWKEIKKGLEATVNDFQQTVKRATTRFD